MGHVASHSNRQPSGSPDLVRLYLDEVGGHDLLSREGEVRLAQAIERGRTAARALAGTPPPDGRLRAQLRADVNAGDAARRTFIEANLRLVVSIAANYRRSGVDLADLIQEGNMALMHAVERFDWRRGNKFSTYATWWIRKAVAEVAGDSATAVHVPRRLRDHARAAAAARRRLEQRLGRTPAPSDLAREVSAERKDSGAVARALAPSVSLSAPVDERGTELAELLADETSNTELEATAALVPGELAAVIATLPPVARRVLRLRYGLGGEAPCSIREVAEEIGLSPERIRQIELRTLLLLRRRLGEVGWAS